ncbi:hypothetical protein CW711_06205 [Candidatus Bathyarchaeota archaeon]|nr:MAG: hypothetical protein B6U84_06390 [Candidatus Bathyarchaeota archaeon ex4484_40]RJS77645.1 MAG: hypothetical protein CW711_06205 [Candidatus Bathyarchaeota archaeon]RLG96613.1 MAG: hypothetical protein DRO29_04375 [Candidatus Bathyarchaeota archaeon]
MENGVRRIVLDVLKLRDPPLPELALRLSSMPNVEGVNISLVEIDQDTESVKVAIEGENLDIKQIQEMMKDHGAVIHSIDEVAVGKKIVTI